MEKRVSLRGSALAIESKTRELIGLHFLLARAEKKGVSAACEIAGDGVFPGLGFHVCTLFDVG